MRVEDFIIIDEDSRIPKYKQIVDSIVFNISEGNLKIDQKILSLNKVCEEYNLSRDTVERAYNILKKRKLIISIRGKGYYIATSQLVLKTNILFLINKLSSYKMLMYNSFIDSIGPNYHTDLQVYHCEESLFLNVLEKYKSSYDYYIIMPHFKTDDFRHISFTDKVVKAVKEIPSDKLIIMDNKNIGIGGDITEIYQDFEDDIYSAFNQSLKIIRKYKRLVLVYPEKAVYPYPKRIVLGFKKFCLEQAFDFEIIKEVCEDIVLKKGDLFITISEADLVLLVKQLRDEEFVLGSDIGVVSYNDSPLKELLGISVISTDFKFLGEKTSGMILNNERGMVRAPFNFIYRNSI